MPENNITIIGFDYGTQWIGSAVGQTQTQTASPLEAIAVSHNKPDWGQIARLIKTWEPDRLVIGFPTTMDGIEGPITQAAKKFSRQLHGRFYVETELVDERLTTREAWQIVEEKARSHISKQQIDCISAVLICETWLHMPENST